MDKVSLLCSCIYCHEVRNARGIFTHVDRAHLGKTQYCQGNNGSYDKVAETKKNKKLDKEKKYLLNPNKCLCCNAILEFDKRNGKFCNQSCSATFNNTGKVRTQDEKRKIAETLTGRVYVEKHKVEIECKECKKIFSKEISGTKKIKTQFCSRSCSSKFIGRIRYKDLDKAGLKYYRVQCGFNFNLKDYPEEFDFALIEQFGWYKAKNHGDNLNGVSRDHMVSVKYGHENGIDPAILAHPANCRLVRHNDNISKGYKNFITLEELLNRINIWNIKYDR